MYCLMILNILFVVDVDEFLGVFGFVKQIAYFLKRQLELVVDVFVLFTFGVDYIFYLFLKLSFNIKYFYINSF